MGLDEPQSLSEYGSGQTSTDAGSVESPPVRYARTSTRGPYACAFPWPENCFVQGGAHGVVGTRTGAYTTAFFEAFPRDPDTFIRGEGTTIVEAEADAWARLQRQLACPGHEFDKRGYTNGLGFCRHCGYSSKVFDPEPERLRSWTGLLLTAGWNPWSLDDLDDNDELPPVTPEKREAVAAARAAWALFLALGAWPRTNPSKFETEMNRMRGIPEVSDDEILAQLVRYCGG